MVREKIMQDRGMEGNGEKKRRKKVVRGRERGKREKKRSLVLIPFAFLVLLEGVFSRLC